MISSFYIAAVSTLIDALFDLPDFFPLPIFKTCTSFIFLPIFLFSNLMPCLIR